MSEHFSEHGRKDIQLGTIKINNIQTARHSFFSGG
jgi:hypothetical protein